MARRLGTKFKRKFVSRMILFLRRYNHGHLLILFLMLYVCLRPAPQIQRNRASCWAPRPPLGHHTVHPSVRTTSVWLILRPRILRSHGKILRTRSGIVVILLLILLCGDVESNPGPMNDCIPVSSQRDALCSIENFDSTCTEKSAGMKVTSSNQSNTDYTKCLICQKAGHLVQATENSYSNFIDKLAIRRSFNDAKYTSLFDRVDTENLDGNLVKWHLRTCYAEFCNKAKIGRLSKKSVSKGIPSRPSGSATRSRKSTINEGLCVFCQVRKPKLQPPSTVGLGNVRLSILRIASKHEIMGARLQGRDPAGLKYHPSCYMKCRRSMENEQGIKTEEKSFDEPFRALLNILDVGLRQGHAFTMTVLAEKYRELLGPSDSTYPTWRLKNKLRAHYGDDLVFLPPRDQTHSTVVMLRSMVHATMSRDVTMDHDSEEEFCFMNDSEYNETASAYMTSLKIRGDLQITRGMDNISTIDEETAASIVPDSLYSFLSMVICGEGKPTETQRRHIISIGQDIVYAYSNGRKMTPKHLGLAATLHHETRSKKIIELVHSAGHCISYDTLIRAQTSLAKNEIERFHKNGEVFLPECLRPEGPLVHFAVDNIDLLVNTKDGKGSFHGTNMAAFQDSDDSFIGDRTETTKATVKMGRDRSLNNVPTGLVDVSQFNLARPSKTDPPPTDKPLSPSLLPDFFEWCNGTFSWLEEQTKGAENTWTDYNKMNSPTSPKTKIGYMPIINAPAHEFATLHTVFVRCANIVKKLGMKYTVITVDEQLYEKGISLIWTYPHRYANVILRMGGFHIALNYLKIIGKRFKASGLTDCWVESNLFGPQVAEKASGGGHYNRSTRGLKITLQALWRLLHDNDEEVESLQTQIEKFKSKSGGTSEFWKSYIRMASIFLNFVSADREGNWTRHLEAFEEMLPDFAAYDGYRYMRWGTIYLQQMKALNETAPEVYSEFMAGRFVVNERSGAFNGVSPDLALEHINRTCKGDGGLTGITNNDSALQRWSLIMASSIGLSTMTREMLGLLPFDDDETHPDNEHSSKKTPQYTAMEMNRVEQLMEQMEIIHPFTQDEQNPINIASGQLAPDPVAQDLREARAKGENKLKDFLSRPVGAFHEPVKMLNLRTFNSLGQPSRKRKINELRENLKAYSKLFRAKAQCNVAMKREHTTTYPFSIMTENRFLRTPSNKSTLTIDLTGDVEDCAQIVNNGSVTCLVVDAMHVVSTMKTKNIQTFGEFSDRFCWIIFEKARKLDASRIDVVFDRYIDQSIKTTTRKKRTANVTPIIIKIGDRRTPLPVNWNAFKASAVNKRCLQNFLSYELLNSASNHCEVIVSGGFVDVLQVQSSTGRSVDQLSSSHEEADVRMMLHCKDAKTNGYTRAVVMSKDTDVLVLLMHFHAELPEQVFMDRGATASSFVPVHEVIKIHHDSPVLENLPGFHALTGSDSTSQFRGHSKISAWKVFQKNPNLLTGFGTRDLEAKVLKSAEKFVVEMYSQKLSKKDQPSLNSADEMRVYMIENFKSVQSLPPTSANLKYHIERANYQAFVWRQATIPKPDIPSPTDHGWRLDGGTLMPESTR